MKSYHLLLAVSLVVVRDSAQGQTRPQDDRVRGQLQRLVDNYKTVHDLIVKEDEVSAEAIFNELFVDQSVRLERDYFDPDDDPEVFSSPAAYFNMITAFLIKNEDSVTDVDIRTSSNDETFYAKHGNWYFAWLKKTFSYNYKGQRKVISVWVRLTIVHSEQFNEMRILAIDRVEAPVDDDGDKIPNLFDDWKTTTRGASTDLRGCELQAIVDPLIRADKGNGVSGVAGKKDKVVKPVVVIKEPRRKPIPPSARYSLEFTGGGIMPAGTSFSNRNLLDYATNTWKDSGALAGLAGYSAELSLHYYMTNWLGIGIGVQHLYLPFADEKLLLQIKNYLGNAGINYRSVAVNSDAYRLHLFYSSLALGTFKSKRMVFRVEGLAGLLYSDVVWDNRLDINVDAGGSQQTSSISLKYDPFPVYGSKITLQWGFGEYGNVRFQLSGVYLSGKSDGASREFHFNAVPTATPTSAPAGFIIPAPDLKLAMVTAGFHITLHNPQQK